MKRLRLPRRYAPRNDIFYGIATLRSQRRIGTLVKRRDILRVNRRIHLRVSADECSYIFEKDILRVSSENRLNEALG